jgi:hypothetical protein
LNDTASKEADNQVAKDGTVTGEKAWGVFRAIDIG